MSSAASAFPIPVSPAQLSAWMQMYLWPFLRIGALLLTAPPFNAQAVAPRVRLGLAVPLTLILAPLLPAAPTLTTFGAAWGLQIARELIVGAALGLALQLVFDAVIVAGELISFGMGLGFAQLADPLRGAGAPMLGQFYQVFSVMLFFAFGGHLQLMHLLVDSFRAAPPGAAAPDADALMSLAQFGGLCFSGGLRVALPAVLALLLVNLSFGVMNRSAPALNAMSLGFPLSLIVGLVVLRFALPQLPGVLSDLLGQAFTFAGGWTR
jgi:flagellar biosynthetic protein FliR